MKAKLIAVGERAPRWVAEGFGEYQKRLSHWLPLELVEVEPGLRGKGRDPVRAMQDEGTRVVAALPKGACVVALDGRGRTWSSEDLAQRLEFWRAQGRDLAFLIGGVSQWLAWGLGMGALGLGALHALTMGCLASLMLAMVTRVSCGHSGRALVADRSGRGMAMQVQDRLGPCVRSVEE